MFAPTSKKQAPGARLASSDRGEARLPVLEEEQREHRVVVFVADPVVEARPETSNLDARGNGLIVGQELHQPVATAKVRKPPNLARKSPPKPRARIEFRHDGTISADRAPDLRSGPFRQRGRAERPRSREAKQSQGRFRVRSLANSRTPTLCV